MPDFLALNDDGSIKYRIYRFDTFEALEDFFLKNFDRFNEERSATKVIGKSLIVFPKKERRA